MTFSCYEMSKDKLNNFLLIEESTANLEEKVYEALLQEDSNINQAYSETGHLHPEKNTPQYIWFKGSRDRGLRGNIAA